MPEGGTGCVAAVGRQAWEGEGKRKRKRKRYFPNCPSQPITSRWSRIRASDQP